MTSEVASAVPLFRHGLPEARAAEYLLDILLMFHGLALADRAGFDMQYAHKHDLSVGEGP